MQEHKRYIERCIELAKKGLGNVSPNPMVGSVIVYNGKIIGEGYHRKFGEAHAEVNAINSVKSKELLKKSTLYVSLEPCSHIGKTPSCADLIIKLGIPRVVIGSVDPYFKVAGKGIKKLKDASVQVTTGVLDEYCQFLNRRFYTFHIKKRPYIILKWAQTSDGFIDRNRNDSNEKPTWITNEYCRTLVHKWRTEEDSILVGKNTVMLDNPQLNSRNWAGHNPVRIVIDKSCELNDNYKVFDNHAETIVFNSLKDYTDKNINYKKIDFNGDTVRQMLDFLCEKDIQSVIIEGGTQTLNVFISQNLWDEARVFTGDLTFERGISAPVFDKHYASVYNFGNSELKIFYNKFCT